MKRIHPSRRAALAARLRHSRGVSLVEIMVGLLIGLVVTLVVAEVLAFAEGQKRTTTSGTDAQTNGALALYTIQRDVQMGGYGLTTGAGGVGCAIKAQYQGQNFNLSLVGVEITDGASGQPDTIVTSMSDTDFSVPYRITENHPAAASNFFLQSALGIADGDLLVAVPPTCDANNWASVIQVTGFNAGGGGGNQGGGQGLNQINHNSGANGSDWNQAGQGIFPNAGYPAGSHMINLGRFEQRRYQINANRSLEFQGFDLLSRTTTTLELFPQIVQLQAMYGKDTDANGVVDTWNATAPASNAQWRQVTAVRIAVVARSQTYEKEPVTTTNPLWDVGTVGTVAGSATCGSSQCVSIDVGIGTGSTDRPERHYRYKVFDVIVPLRNIIWST
jgi:type IV pilus assembly protein PilW